MWKKGKGSEKKSEMTFRQRCSACRVLRETCLEDCVFRDYFPPGQKLEEFIVIRDTRNVNEIHGNLLILKKADRDVYMESILFEIRNRTKWPIGGALREFQLLKDSSDVTIKKLSERLVDADNERMDTPPSRDGNPFGSSEGGEAKNAG